MTEITIPGFEDNTSTSSMPKKRRTPKKRKKVFKLNLDELFHIELYGNLPTAGKTPLPVLKPMNRIYPQRLVPFHVAYSTKDYDCTVHFFIDDSLFIRVLRHPEKYLAFFQKCHSVIGPDLSQYSNMSAEDRYYCAYINRAFTAYLQRNGVCVIPNLTWSLPDNYEYSTAGMPTYSVVAVNSKGVRKYNASKYLWRRGYETSYSILHPTLIVRYGPKMPDEHTEISIFFENERLNKLKYGS